MADGSWHWKKNHFRVEHRPRAQHRNADSLSKRTNDCRWRERQLEKLPPVAERWNFLFQNEYERLPTAPWFDQQGLVISNHPELPIHLKNLQPNPPDLVQRVIRRSKRAKRRAKRIEALQRPLPSTPPPILHAHEDFYPEYPEEPTLPHVLPMTWLTSKAQHCTMRLPTSSRQ